jgi:phosphoesterase RecJ-like protein
MLFKEVRELIDAHQDILLLTHILPDGDAIGSLLGLSLILNKRGKNVTASWGNRFLYPSQYSFLTGQGFLKPPDKLPDSIGLLLALDCGSPERLGSLEKLLKRAGTTVNIDHHRNNSAYADTNVIDSGFSSTAEMIFEFAKECGATIDKDIAENLYTGVVTDTGRFQYTNTKAETLKVAAELIEFGADPSKIFRNVYENSTFARLKLAGLALSKAVLDSDLGFIYTAITKDDFQATSSSVEDTENLIDFLRAVTSVKVAAVFKETDGGWRVSLRSTGVVDVGAIAESKNGGGHRLAAGYNPRGDFSQALADLRATLMKEAT